MPASAQNARLLTSAASIKQSTKFGIYTAFLPNLVQRSRSICPTFVSYVDDSGEAQGIYLVKNSLYEEILHQMLET
jgi:hypothetical protein